MNILVTLQKCWVRDFHMPDVVIDELKRLGNVRLNASEEAYSEEELKENIKDIDICLTHWGCPVFSDKVLINANRLKMIAHAAGTVASFVGKEVYDREIIVCTANRIMAKFVAEGALAYILAGLRSIPQHNKEVKEEYKWLLYESESLYKKKVGLIGLGSVGRWLLELLKPFEVKIRLFDPYISRNQIMDHPEVELCSLEDVLSWSDVISIHAARTPETYHILDSKRLKLIRDGALLVNTARGAIIDEGALYSELKTGRFSAVLDVFEVEPLPEDSPLRNLENVILMPHRAGCGIRTEMTLAMIDEIRRFQHGEPLQYQVSFDTCKLMTR